MNNTEYTEGENPRCVDCGLPGDNLYCEDCGDSLCYECCNEDLCYFCTQEKIIIQRYEDED